MESYMKYTMIKSKPYTRDTPDSLRKDYNRVYYLANKDKIKAAAIEHKRLHKDRHKETRLTRSAKRREYVLAYKLSHPCVVCGETDPIVLDFDHLDPTIKEREVSDMVVQDWSLLKIKEEISKCQILCANCHRRKTYRDLQKLRQHDKE